MVSELIGQVVSNDGVALKRALAAHLEIRNFLHIGNFVFSAEMPNKIVIVAATPVDEDFERMRIMSISVFYAIPPKHPKGGKCVSHTILHQIVTIRNTGETNMFDISRVERIAMREGFYELVLYLEKHKSAYYQIILTGKLNDDEYDDDEYDDDEDPLVLW
jgi:hypothetical protein